MIRAIHHIQLSMPRGREDDARAFYRDVLGMTEQAKPENLARRGGVWFRAGDAEVHLGVEDDFRPAKKAHPALLVTNLQELLERCRDAGCAVTTDEPLPGYDRAYVADPFGNRIELLEAIAEDTITMYRPVGPTELRLLEESGFRRWPPRLPEQPIFYPVTNEQYAAEIASRWNAADDGVGYVTRFSVRRSSMQRYEIHKVGAAHHTEWWVPAEELEQLNDNIVGVIDVIGEYCKPKP